MSCFRPVFLVMFLRRERVEPPSFTLGRTGTFRQLQMLCFQSINTSCETCRQEAGSNRKCMQETEAELGVAPGRDFTLWRLMLLMMGPLHFYFSSFHILWELKNLFFLATWIQIHSTNFLPLPSPVLPNPQMSSLDLKYSSQLSAIPVFIKETILETRDV